MRQKKPLPRLVIFGDPKKGPVAEAIEDFSNFLKGKAQIICGCYLEKCTAEVIRKSDFAVVLGGDGSIISAASPNSASANSRASARTSSRARRRSRNG